MFARVRSNTLESLLPIQVSSDQHNLILKGTNTVHTGTGIVFIPYTVNQNTGHAIGDDWLPLSSLLHMHSCDTLVSSRGCTVLSASRTPSRSETPTVVGAPVVDMLRQSGAWCADHLVIGYEGLSYVDTVYSGDLAHSLISNFRQRVYSNLLVPYPRDVSANLQFSNCEMERIILLAKKSEGDSHRPYYANFDELVDGIKRRFSVTDSSRRCQSKYNVIVTDWANLTLPQQLSILARTVLFITPPGGGALNALWLPKHAWVVTYCNLRHNSTGYWLDHSWERSLLTQLNSILHVFEDVCIDTTSNGEHLMSLSNNQLYFEVSHMTKHIKSQIHEHCRAEGKVDCTFI